MKDGEFTIHIQLGGMRIPLRIDRKDEEIYRKAEKTVLTYLDRFNRQYSQRPTEEILTLVAYQLAVLVSKKELSEDTVPMVEKIKTLDKELEEFLSK